MKTMVFGNHVGQHSNMPVRLALSYFCTAAAKDLVHGTVNAVQLESATQGCVNANNNNNI